MFDVPGNPNIKEILVTPESIKGDAEPVITYRSEKMVV
jgi:ATP-dependent protease Clp ATPase subunit